MAKAIGGRVEVVGCGGQSRGKMVGDGGKRCGMVVVGQQRCGGGAGLRSARAATVLPPPWVPIVVGGHVH